MIGNESVSGAGAAVAFGCGIVGSPAPKAHAPTPDNRAAAKAPPRNRRRERKESMEITPGNYLKYRRSLGASRSASSFHRVGKLYRPRSGSGWISESWVPLFVAFAFLAVAWLLVAVGLRGQVQVWDGAPASGQRLGPFRKVGGIGTHAPPVPGSRYTRKLVPLGR